jgi:hypothetical protein
MESVIKLMVNYLRQVPEELVKKVENQLPDPCLLCNEEISLNPLTTHAVVSCGHIFHWNCFTKLASYKCPICKKEFEQNYYKSLNDAEAAEGGRIDTESISSLSSPRDNIVSIKSPKHIRDSSVSSDSSEISNKKTKKSKNSMFIQELSNDNPVQPFVNQPTEIIQEKEEKEENIFFNLNIKITNAETRYNVTNQEVIKNYYLFGKALLERLNLYKENYMEHEAQKKVNEEVRQQLPNNVTEDTLRKRKEKARKVYNLFNRIGEDKIMRVRTITASEILKLRWNDIEYIVSKILNKSESYEETVN